jgi:hypothetical protein
MREWEKPISPDDILKLFLIFGGQIQFQVFQNVMSSSETVVEHPPHQPYFKGLSPTTDIGIWMAKIAKKSFFETCGLYYKHVSIVNDASSGVNK